MYIPMKLSLQSKEGSFKNMCRSPSMLSYSLRVKVELLLAHEAVLIFLVISEFMSYPSVLRLFCIAVMRFSWIPSQTHQCIAHFFWVHWFGTLYRQLFLTPYCDSPWVSPGLYTNGLLNDTFYNHQIKI